MAEKIMFYTPSLNIGGIERVFITYANALCKHYDIYYVYSHDCGDLSLLLDSKINNCSLGNVRLRNSLKAFINVIKKYSPDVLITGGDISNCFCILSTVLSRKKPKVIISHHNYFNLEGNKLLSSFLIRYIYNWADYVISVSNGISQLLLQNGVHKEKLVTIYNPIDIDQIRVKSEDDCVQVQKEYLISVGRLSEVKNIPLMIDAFSIVLQKYPDLYLLIVGDGELKEQIDMYIKEKRLSEKILLLGTLSNPYPLMKGAKLVLSSSLSEALPTVVLEAFALGKTVVATPTNGSIELLGNGQYGYLSKSLTGVNDLAEKICQAYDMPIDSSKLQKSANRFSVDVKVKEIEALWG